MVCAWITRERGGILDNSHIHPNFLFILSYYSRLLNKYEDSIEYGERYRLRDPSNIDNLNNLIISYQEIGNTDRAGRIQELLLSIQ